MGAGGMPCSGELQFWSVMQSQMRELVKQTTRIANALEKRAEPPAAKCGTAPSPLTIDEAIAHADEVAGDCSTACKRDHKQLADWLRELKARRNAEGRPL